MIVAPGCEPALAIMEFGADRFESGATAGSGLAKSVEEKSDARCAWTAQERPKAFARWVRATVHSGGAVRQPATGSAVGSFRTEVAPSDGFGDLVTHIAPAVVNVSTRKDVAPRRQTCRPMPQLPPGSPFEEFFKEFIDRDKQQQQQQPRRGSPWARASSSTTSGFVVTNNHVIQDADEITVIFSDEADWRPR